MIVQFDTAKLAKEKGFDMPATYAYCQRGGWNIYKQIEEPLHYILKTDGNPFGEFYKGKNFNIFPSNSRNRIQCSAPTQSELQTWLRNIHKIIVYMIYCYNDKGWTIHIEDIKNMEIDENSVLISGMDFGFEIYPTYEIALEAGLLQALKLI